MSSPYHDVNRRAAAALRANPTAVAGLSAFDDRPDDLRVALGALAGCVRGSRWTKENDAAATLYAMVRVAQQEYGGGDGGYWPHLGRRMGTTLGATDHRWLGDQFRFALGVFGFPTNLPGLTNLGPILWHAGWSRPHLRPLLAFVAEQVAVYGGRAAEPDAPHALRLGPVAQTYTPALPRTVVRLLEGNAAGFGELWARLAGAVFAHRQGAAAVRAAWEPIGGITADDILAALPTARPPASAVPCPRRPQLRYHPDTGELRLWLVEGSAADWRVDGLELRWEGDSAVVVPPLRAAFSLTHRPTKTAWTEVLFAEKPAAWFGGRSGVLERGDEVAARGLTAGRYHLVCRGVPAGLPPAARGQLSLGFYAGGEGWAAWEVEVPARSEGAAFTLRVDGDVWRFPLARGSEPLLRVDGEPVGRGELPGGAPVSLFAGPPRVELQPGTAVRLVRRSETDGQLVGDWTAGAGAASLPDRGPGVYQLREARGVGRVLLDYAVVPGSSAPVVTVTGDVARLVLKAGPGGRLDGAHAIPGGWAVEQPAWHPWVEVVWRWDGGGLPVRLRAAVRAVRWRLAGADGPRSEWGRHAHPVSRREAAARRLRVHVEVPAREGLAVNGSPPAAEPTEGPTGWGLTLPLDAFPTADAVQLRAGGREFVTAWLADRPVLRSFEALRDGEEVVACWEAEHAPAGLLIGLWDPTDPGGEVVTVPVSAEQARYPGGEWPVPPAVAGCRRLGVALGTRGAGFGARPFQPAVDPNGCPVTALLMADDDAAADWARVAHGWTVRLRWGDGADRAAADLQRLGSTPPWGEMLEYVTRLPAGGFRARLTEILSRVGGPGAADAVAAAADPMAALAAWLAAGVHPFWHAAAARPAPRACAYPYFYLARLALLDDPAAPAAARAEAASDVYQFHKALPFSPLAGLPFAAAVVRNTPLTVRGKVMPGVPHTHKLGGTADDDENQFTAQTTGVEACWDLPAMGGDPHPRTSARPAPPRARTAAGSKPVREGLSQCRTSWPVRPGHDLAVSGRNQAASGTVPMNTVPLEVKARPCSFTRKRPPFGNWRRSALRKVASGPVVGG